MRRLSIEMTHAFHVASGLLVADIIAVLYTNIANVFPSDRENDAKDRIILSKEHLGMAVYVALAEQRFFSEEDIMTNY